MGDFFNIKDIPHTYKVGEEVFFDDDYYIIDSFSKSKHYVKLIHKHNLPRCVHIINLGKLYNHGDDSIDNLIDARLVQAKIESISSQLIKLINE